MPSPTLLIVGMRDVESDWSASRGERKVANQSGDQIQVVNPEPAFACSAPELAGVRLLPLPRLLLLPEPPLKPLTLVLGRQEKLKMV